MDNWKHPYTSGSFTQYRIDELVILNGRGAKRRDYDRLIFNSRRDRYGGAQIASDPARNESVQVKITKLVNPALEKHMFCDWETLFLYTYKLTFKETRKFLFFSLVYPEFRTDRHIEFFQIDYELSFVEDFMQIFERVIRIGERAFFLTDWLQVQTEENEQALREFHIRQQFLNLKSEENRG